MNWSPKEQMFRIGHAEQVSHCSPILLTVKKQSYLF